MGHKMVERRAKRKNWSKDVIDAKHQRVEERQENLKGVLGALAGAAVSVAPGGAIAGSVLDAIPGVRKLPVIKEVTEAAAIELDFSARAKEGFAAAVIKDLIPVYRRIEDGEYKKAALELLVILAPLAALLV